MARMDFGIGLGAELRFDEIADHARVADEGGYTHLTFVDQSNVSRECFGMMTIAAMNTRRIHIGQGVCDPFMYHPAVIANFTASLRELTGGRAFIGLGAGAREAGKATRGPVSLKMQRETVNFLKSYTSGGRCGAVGPDVALGMDQEHAVQRPVDTRDHGASRAEGDAACRRGRGRDSNVRGG